MNVLTWIVWLFFVVSTSIVTLSTPMAVASMPPTSAGGSVIPAALFAAVLLLASLFGRLRVVPHHLARGRLPRASARLLVNLAACWVLASMVLGFGIQISRVTDNLTYAIVCGAVGVAVLLMEAPRFKLEARSSSHS